MIHLQRMFADAVLEAIEAYYRLRNAFRKKPDPSLIASNVFWCTNSEWMDRLIAYRQLELWTFDK